VSGSRVGAGRHAWTDDERAVYAEVGARIRATRRRLGLSQAALAEMCGLVRSSVTNIENGRQGMSLPLFLSLADALNVDPADLLNGGPR
jgi:transcriptional regulator with XRE-family HTH domain